MNRLLRTLPAVAAVAALGVTGSANAATAKHATASAPTTLYACVSHAHGTSIRFVTGPRCAHGESLLVFHAAKHHRTGAKKHTHGQAGPQGPAGKQGATGKRGPAGKNGTNGTQGPAGANGSNGSNGSNGTSAPSVAVKDANGNAVGTLLFWSTGSITVLTNNETVVTFDAGTGNYAYPQLLDLFYADASCHTTPYAPSLLAPANVPFALSGLTAPGKPLYTVAGPPQANLSYQAMSNGSGCSASPGTLPRAYPVSQAGVVPASPFIGPLTLG